jgi:general secretion pathway protein A
MSRPPIRGRLAAFTAPGLPARLRMYLEHYGLTEPPFSITPDPRFVFLSERHRDALAHLLFGIGQGGSGGFVQLTGEVGTGKTTLSRLLLEQIPDNTRIALVLNPRLSALELLETICEELHLDIEGRRGSTKALVDALNAYLLDAYAQGLRVVVVIDEAQNLPVDALEQVRLLTNLETDTQKLLQIVLLGQPELRDMLAREDLRQLAQRITARFHLMPLDARETSEYLRHRYRVAGGQRFPFSENALRKVHARSGGVPRLINVIAERALLAGYARDAQVIDDKLVALAADEMQPPRVRNASSPHWPWLAVAGATALIAAFALLWPSPQSAPVASEARASSATSGAVAPTSAGAAPAVAQLDAAQAQQRLATGPVSPLRAWQQLLALWKQPADAITVDASGACTSVTAGLHCAAGRAPLDRLLALDRPVLLPLRASGAQTWALLLGADARRARLQLLDAAVELDRATLQAAWDGRYYAVWQGPAELASPPMPGTGGAGVAWLRTRLALPAVTPAQYDAAVSAAVRGFQQARGLPADGVAGSETLIALADDTGPRLLRELK